MSRALLALAAAMALSACASGYDYAYDYDPLRGPRGHYLDPANPRPPLGPECAKPTFIGPFEDGFRAPYYVGPFCAAKAPPAA
jgi:hypothetical protein